MELEKKDWENFLKETEQIIKNLKLNLRINEICRETAKEEIKKFEN